MFWMEKVKICNKVNDISCSAIVDRKDHVQYLTIVVIVNLSCLYDDKPAFLR